MTRGCPGLSFINSANRAMALLNIGISDLALKSNVQVGNKLFMDEVIGKALSMKSARAAVQEYDTELPLAIAILECRFGRNVDVAISTSTDVPAVITEDEDDEE